MKNLGNPIVLHIVVAVCDGCGAEYTTITDGHFAYAYGEATDIPIFAQSTQNPTRITGACTMLMVGEPCHGEVTSDLTSNDWGSATPDDIRVLNEHGHPIERA